MERRDALKSLAMVAGSLTFSNKALHAFEPGRKDRKVLTVAHITDVHIRPDYDAPNRFKNCLKQIVKHHQPDFFLNGGDSIYDASYNSVVRERVHELWNIWDDCWKSLNKKYDIYSCIGNHDPWWKAPDKDDEMYGKPYVGKRLNMPDRYFRAQKGNWHFIILDGNNKGIMLDEEQLLWLEKELTQIPADHYVALMSHYPVLSATVQLQGGGHSDFRQLKDLFYKHRDKVRLFLSGHNHLLDETVYNKVTYCSTGAVSGYWWEDGDKESAGHSWFKQTPPGYTILKLHPNGIVEHTYHAHGF
ncbi:metallophosphoesterase [Niabella defluvii]|nr:metallophosphoesterase [Niabella sp. I65]